METEWPLGIFVLTHRAAAGAMAAVVQMLENKKHKVLPPPPSPTHTHTHTSRCTNGHSLAQGAVMPFMSTTASRPPSSPLTERGTGGSQSALFLECSHSRPRSVRPQTHSQSHLFSVLQLQPPWRIPTAAAG